MRKGKSKVATKIRTKSVTCPRCAARPGQDCKSSRISSSNTLGGGWGGYAPLTRSHSERVELARSRSAALFDG